MKVQRNACIQHIFYSNKCDSHEKYSTFSLVVKTPNSDFT